MHRYLLSIVILLAACSGATGPKAPAGIDPTVLFSNTSTVWMNVSWMDQQTGVISTTTVAPGPSQCLHLTLPPGDSIQLVVWDTIFVNGAASSWVTLKTPYFLDGQPFTVVNGIYVSDFWTITAATGNVGNIPPVLITPRADSTTPC